ncbi:hypothetical protein PG984_013465 [Apiospora sp. TS-2023a]
MVSPGVVDSFVGFELAVNACGPNYYGGCQIGSSTKKNGKGIAENQGRLSPARSRNLVAQPGPR